MCRLRRPLRDRKHRSIAHGQTTRGQILHRQIAYRQTLHRQITYRQTLHRQIVYRQALHRQIAYGQTLHRQTAHRQILHRQILHRQTAHKCCVHRQMTHKHGTSGQEDFPLRPLSPLQPLCLLLHPLLFLPVLRRQQGFQGRPIFRLFPPCSRRRPYSGKEPPERNRRNDLQG